MKRANTTQEFGVEIVMLRWDQAAYFTCGARFSTFQDIKKLWRFSPVYNIVRSSADIHGSKEGKSPTPTCLIVQGHADQISLFIVCRLYGTGDPRAVGWGEEYLLFWNIQGGSVFPVCGHVLPSVHWTSWSEGFQVSLSQVAPVYFLVFFLIATPIYLL